MNVTIKIDDQVCKEARHRAVDAGLSLSGWIAKVIRSELSRSDAAKPKTLLEALGNDMLAEANLDFPRDQGGSREMGF